MHTNISSKSSSIMPPGAVTVVGGGLAGCEAAWQLAQAGIPVRLVDMKPLQRNPAQESHLLAELVCSNSLRSLNRKNAVGLLKEEMQRLGSLVIQTALACRVPAGDALAVDRRQFSAAITERIDNHPCITRVAEVATTLPPPDAPPHIIATGPLTDAALATDIVRLTGAARLYFYDALAPIISAESIDRSIVYAASRYGKGDGADYLNCPLNRAQYEAFLAALSGAETMPLHAFEEPRYFQGCLPIEVIAASGPHSLRFGPMKPVGLDDPRTGRWPYAVVQLRQEDLLGQAYNLVGFQTKLKQPEQLRVLRLIPGLERAEFLRYGAIHRNTFIDSPQLLDERMRLRLQPNIRFAGQITGVEGYVESAAHGLLTGLLLAHELRPRQRHHKVAAAATHPNPSAARASDAPLAAPPATTALGALWHHVLGSHRLAGRPHEPQNINWAMFAPANAAPPATPQAVPQAVPECAAGKAPKAAPKSQRQEQRTAQATLAFNAWAQEANFL